MASAAEVAPLLAADAKRVGILGGTFDPIHVGHVEAAKAVLDALGLDQVLFMPAGVPVYKLDQYVTPAEHRIAMTQLAIQDEPRFAVDTREIDRGGKTYTADTLRQMTAEYPGVSWTFIAGADAALTIPKWKESQVIADLARIAVVSRPGCVVDPASPGYQQLMECFQVDWVDVRTPDVASSNLRQAICAGEVKETDLPPGVYDYIKKHGLYGLN